MPEEPIAATEAAPVEQRYVSERYTEMAALYADLFVAEIHDQPETLATLADLAEQARALGSTVIDAGCGPGHVTEHLHTLGATAIGIERSSGMLEQARARFPNRDFCRGSITDLGVATASAAGIVSRFSTIHLPPDGLPAVFAEYARVLKPGGMLVLGFFATDTLNQHGNSFDHKVATAYRADVDVMADMLNGAGFVETDRNFTPKKNRRSHASLIARRLQMAQIPPFSIFGTMHDSVNGAIEGRLTAPIETT